MSKGKVSLAQLLKVTPPAPPVPRVLSRLLTGLDGVNEPLRKLDEGPLAKRDPLGPQREELRKRAAELDELRKSMADIERRIAVQEERLGVRDIRPHVAPQGPQPNRNGNHHQPPPLFNRRDRR